VIDDAVDDIAGIEPRRLTLRLARRALRLSLKRDGELVTAHIRGEQNVQGALARLRTCAHDGSVVDATEVVTRAGVDLDFDALAQEERTLDLGARRDRRGLGAGVRAVTLEARLRVGDLGDDRR